MKSKLKCIMLIDDDEDDNFFHELVTREAEVCEKIHVSENAFDALDYIRSARELPEIIFVDINMPKMNGWEFIEEYSRINKPEKTSTLIFILTTSPNPLDFEKARKSPFISGFKSKPLSVEILNDVYSHYFSAASRG